MDKIIQKAVEALPGGAVGGLIGGILGYLLAEQARADACTGGIGRSTKGCVDAMAQLGPSVALGAFVGALVAAAGYAAYKATQRPKPTAP